MTYATWPEHAPRDVPYRCWTSDTDEQHAIVAFEQRHGQRPEFAIRHKGLLWLGPEPQPEEDNHD